MYIIDSLGERYECASAQQRGNKLYLLDEFDEIIVIFDRSVKIKKVEEGEITVIEAPLPTAEEDMMAMLVDQEYRLTVLELTI